MSALTPLILGSLERVQVINYLYFVTAAVLLYDHIITIGDEATYVWPAKWSLGKVLFILARYPPYIDISFVLFHQLGKSVPVSLCHDAFRVAGWTNLFGIAVTEIILIMRTWALYGRNPYVPIGLGVLGVLALAAACYMLNLFLESLTFILIDHLSPLLNGCFVSGGSKLVFVDFVILMIYETMIIVLTLIVGVQHYRQGFHQSSFMMSLFKDGILYYLYLFMFSVLNVIVPLTAPRESVQLLIELQRVMHSICSARILLHLRQGMARKQNTIAGNTTIDPAIGSRMMFDSPTGGAANSSISRDLNDSFAEHDPHAEADTPRQEGNWFGEEEAGGTTSEVEMKLRHSA